MQRPLLKPFITRWTGLSVRMIQTACRQGFVSLVWSPRTNRSYVTSQNNSGSEVLVTRPSGPVMSSRRRSWCWGWSSAVWSKCGTHHLQEELWRANTLWFVTTRQQISRRKWMGDCRQVNFNNYKTISFYNTFFFNGTTWPPVVGPGTPLGTTALKCYKEKQHNTEV